MGRHSVFFAKHGFEVTAIDLSEIVLDETKKWAQKEKVEIN